MMNDPIFIDETETEPIRVIFSSPNDPKRISMNKVECPKCKAAFFVAAFKATVQCPECGVILRKVPEDFPR